VVKIQDMGKLIITQKQLDQMVKILKENQEEGSYMAKQQLFTIATLAYKMWEMMEEGEQLEDWMETKIAQSEQSITSVVKSFMYDEVEGKVRGSSDINFDDIIIGM
jgi:hypothetical protein